MRSLLIASVLLLIAANACADIRIDEHLNGTRDRTASRCILRDLVAAVFEEAKPRLGLSLLLPTEGRITSLFGGMRDPFLRRVRHHEGIDIAHAPGAAVRAAASGRVVAAGRMGGCGLAAVLDHGAGLSTRYCHLEALAVRRGERVLSGQAIGRMGSTGRSTGSHLHFEVRDHGVPVDPAERLYY